MKLSPTYPPTHPPTYLPTPWIRVLENLTGFQLVKKFPALYVSRKLITAFKSALTFSYPEPVLSGPYPTSHFLRSILILSSDLRLGFSSGLFPSGFPTKTLYTPLLSPHTRYIPRPSHSYPFYRQNNNG